MTVNKLGKAAIHVAHGGGRIILHISKQLTNSNPESDREPSTSDNLISYLIDEKRPFHILCLCTNLKVTRFSILKVMTIKEQLTVDWNDFIFSTKWWRWGKWK